MHSLMHYIEVTSSCCQSMRLWPVAAGGSARDIVEDLTYEGEERVILS